MVSNFVGPECEMGSMTLRMHYVLLVRGLNQDVKVIWRSRTDSGCSAFWMITWLPPEIASCQCDLTRSSSKHSVKLYRHPCNMCSFPINIASHVLTLRALSSSLATFSVYIPNFHFYAHCRVIQNTLLEFTHYLLFLINIMILFRKISGYSKAFNSTDLFFTFFTYGELILK